MSQKLKQARDQVQELLEKHPSLRDDHSRLVVNIWHKELKTFGVEITPAIKEVLTLITRNLTSSDTITRTSRLLQETVPELQGRDWKKRQAHTKKVKTEIKELKSEVAEA